MYSYPTSTPLNLKPSDVVSEQGVTFAAISLVLVITGLVSGIGTLFVLAGIAALVSCGFTVATIFSSVTADDTTQAPRVMERRLP